MSLTKKRRAELDRFIIEQISCGEKSFSQEAIRKFKVSRQTIAQHIQRLRQNDIILSEGKGRNTSYSLKKHRTEVVITIGPSVSEDEVWREKIAPCLGEIAKHVYDICCYGFTEMLNNVIDHSSSLQALCVVEEDYAWLTLIVRDYGVGIFNKIQSDFKLDDPRHAILELAKGKLTSDPARHTGEGIFFVSKAVDYFTIQSGTLLFESDRDGGEHLYEDSTLDVRAGTEVTMKIKKSSSLKIAELFNVFAAAENDHRFTKTRITVELLQYEGEPLISRSQAKRLIARFEQFEAILLDFKGVAVIGQAFADEVFRVFHNRHPEVLLSCVNTNADVEKIILHVTA